MRMSTIKVLGYLIAIAMVFTYGIVGTYTIGADGGFKGYPKGSHSILNATYFTVVTLGTVGYGDIIPVTPEARAFVIILILAGVSVFLSAVAVIGGEFMTSRIENLYGSISAFDKRLFSSHVVLIGTNNTNQYLAEKLKHSGIRTIIVTSDKVKAEQLKSQGFHTFIADATSDSDMKKFNLDKAKSIVIDVKDGSRAIYVLLVARSIAKSAKIVVLAPTAEAAKYIRGLNAATNVINPADIAAKEISNAIFSAEYKKEKHL